MLIRQVSVFLENKPGQMAAALKLLAENNVDISALQLADTDNFGILRMIVSDPYKARDLFTACGFQAKISHLVALAMDDTPGGAAATISLLSNAGINIEYMYACIGSVHGKALMVLRVDDRDKAEEILTQNGLNNLQPHDIYRI